MEELNGFTVEELEKFINALGKIISFQHSFFQVEKVKLPFDTLIAQFAVYLKIIEFKKIDRILEIGPGCGYFITNFKRR